MSVDIKNGIKLKIEGKFGKHKALPVEKTVEISESLQETVMSDETVIGSIKIIKNKGKITMTIQETYPKSNHSLSYSPEIINIRNKKYVLNYPLRCLFEKEDNYYIINNEQLDIIGTGLSKEDAEINFNEEFDYLYTRLNSLDDNQLNKRLLRIKYTLNNFVKEVISWF
jgi:hypothetical protein